MNTKLHFGCFNCPSDGWINTDITPHVFVAKMPGLAWVIHKAGKMSDGRYAEHRKGIFKKVHYLDVAKKWRFANNSFSAIYSSHVLEHLSLSAARDCLAECYRCLKTGGILRIAVPDLDAHIRSYDPDHALDWAINLFEANERFEKNMHHFMYNFQSLRALMQAAGFAKITRWGYREGKCPDVGVLDNRPQSLFVEAVK